MEKRGQFTFYRSFWDALRLLSKRDRLPIIEAIVHYALNGEEMTGLQPGQEAFFLLCKPTLDASRKKAVSGKQGGSKPKAKRKQKESEKENEIENEIEIENEYECNKARWFESFWEAYPRKVGKQKAWEAFQAVQAAPERLLYALTQQKRWEQWQREGGRFIPNPATWLSEGRWEDLKPASVEPGVRLPDAEERAAVRRLMEDG